MFELQRNVPIPPVNRSGRTPRRRKYPFESMKVGEMFFVPNKTKNTLNTHLAAVSKQLGHKYRSRLTFMRQGEDGWELCDPQHPAAVQGIGVWRDE